METYCTITVSVKDEDNNLKEKASINMHIYGTGTLN